MICNHGVAGSSPAAGTNIQKGCHRDGDNLFCYCGAGSNSARSNWAGRRQKHEASPVKADAQHASMCQHGFLPFALINAFSIAAHH
jgi:hypothetical protein